MAHHAAVLAAAPFPTCTAQHCRKLPKPTTGLLATVYAAMKLDLCLFTALAKAKGPQGAYFILGQFACTCSTGSFLPSLIHRHPQG